MSAKIDSSIPPPARTPATRPNAAAGSVSAVTSAVRSAGQPVGAVEQSDRVQLTGDAVNLSQFEKTAAQAPTTDRTRVDKVRQSLAEGSYTIDPQKIAARLSRLDGELGPR